jgi:hypothetical protein
MSLYYARLNSLLPKEPKCWKAAGTGLNRNQRVILERRIRRLLTEHE